MTFMKGMNKRQPLLFPLLIFVGTTVLDPDKGDTNSGEQRITEQSCEQGKGCSHLPELCPEKSQSSWTLPAEWQRPAKAGLLTISWPALLP